MEAKPCKVLLAEDDPVSREFLTEALQACGASVTGCDDGDAALATATRLAFDLLVFDHHLPGRNGDAVLLALRANPGAASRATPALATSADPGAFRAGLLAAGFAEVLPKPLPLADLAATLRRHGMPAFDVPAIDHEAALRACGSHAVATRLRHLFANQELPAVAAELARTTDPHALRPMLHRLRSACGFCGATRLADAGDALQRALATGKEADVAPMLSAFRIALAATRTALGDDSA